MIQSVDAGEHFYFCIRSSCWLGLTVMCMSHWFSFTPRGTGWPTLCSASVQAPVLPAELWPGVGGAGGAPEEGPRRQQTPRGDERDSDALIDWVAAATQGMRPAFASDINPFSITGIYTVYPWHNSTETPSLDMNPTDFFHIRTPTIAQKPNWIKVIMQHNWPSVLLKQLELKQPCPGVGPLVFF